MNRTLLVSIIINNYNYGRYLNQAIESALCQTYNPVEVVVVDDGSSDDSRAIIASYGDRVIPVLKENGGQGSAFNAGFAHSHGDVIIFLDSDDLLLSHIAREVATVFDTDPEIAKVLYRLEVIDASGTSTGQVRPPWNQPMPAGDLRKQVLTFPDDISWQPTSGNAFSAEVLRRIFPMPEAEYRICADYYLSNLPPLFGRVATLDEVGGYYRVHGANNHYSSSIDLEQTRQIITRTCHTHAHIQTAAALLGFAAAAVEPTNIPSVTFFANRIVSLKLDPKRHPLQGDKLLSLLRQGIAASLGRFDLSRLRRGFYTLWFLAIFLAPRSFAAWLVEKTFLSNTQGKTSKLVRVFRS